MVKLAFNHKYSMSAFFLLGGQQPEHTPVCLRCMLSSSVAGCRFFPRLVSAFYCRTLAGRFANPLNAPSRCLVAFVRVTADPTLESARVTPRLLVEARREER